MTAVQVQSLPLHNCRAGPSLAVISPVVLPSARTILSAVVNSTSRSGATIGPD
jgi:hypothetical protein